MTVQNGTLKNRLLTLTHGLDEVQLTEEGGEVLLVSVQKDVADRAAKVAQSRADLPAPDRRVVRRGKIYRYALAWEVQS